MPALASSPWKQGRQVIWNAIRATRPIADGTTIRAISRATSIDPRTVRSYVQGLVAAGFLDELPSAVRGKPAHFKLSASGVNSEAPSVRVDGVPTKAQGGGRDRLWRTMKMLKVFTAHDLIAGASLETAPVKLTEAKYYVKWLAAAGYLVVAQPHSTTGKGRKATWRLVKNTGPQPPMIMRMRALWDPNLQAVAYAPAPREQVAA